jgi:hypothetical protein
MMRPTLLLLLAAGTATAAAPEIMRPPATPQALGAPHTLRNVPEACVRIEGAFGTDPPAPYTVTLHARPGCTPRAAFDARVADAAPGGPGWILNDLLRVPRADRPDCVANISVWRHPGALAPLEQDGQRRVRMYLDQDQKPAGERPRFAASLEISAACRN